jgi:UDP-N-acetyl-D-mannosaminuronic acid dehydrogenase
VKISVIGLGYVGFPTAVLFANSGHNVLGVDINDNLVNNINLGKHSIEDNQISMIYKKIIDTNCFKADTNVSEADVYIIAVPTPVQSKKIDLKYVISACKSIATVIKKGDVVIIESTISPGTTEGSVKSELEVSGLKAGEDFYLVHIPERVQPGNIYNELIYNDRIIGGINERSSKVASDLYSCFVKGEMTETDAKTAETTKIIENTYRDVNLAIANEFMVICEKIGVDPWKAIQFANLHPRVNILKPGPGVGGHCIPVDPWFLIEQDIEESLLLQSARSRNDKMPFKVSQDIVEILKEIRGYKVSLLGCTYKANSSDARETPTEVIVKKLEELGVEFSAHDPHLLKQWHCTTESIEACIVDADLITIIVPHKEFLKITSEELTFLTKCRTIFDCTNSFDTDLWKKSGFRIIKLGLRGK